MKIISRSRIVETVSFSLAFDFVGERNCGFAFPCDEHGVIAELTQAGRANYERCLTGSVSTTRGVLHLQPARIERYERTHREPAIGRCACGAEVALSHFTNTCDCGRDYNHAGQELAPREQWGEETGETAADILLGGELS